MCVVAIPDSWEGWYWGAMHHFGNSMRVASPAGGGTMADCRNEAEMVVFWSCDPESTNGAYCGPKARRIACGPRNSASNSFTSTRISAPPPNCSAAGGFPIRPQTHSALAIAIMYVWVAEALYDDNYVATRTTGFDEWKAYLLGDTDGVPKTPEWQEEETGVPANPARALARKWGGKEVHLVRSGMSGPWGFGGAGRGATGTAMGAREALIMMMAMQGWGKPGVNFGNLQMGVPH